MVYYAVARLGAILSPINFWFRTAEIRWTLDPAKPKVFVLSAEWLDMLDERVRGFRRCCSIPQLLELLDGPPMSVDELTAWKDRRLDLGERSRA